MNLINKNISTNNLYFFALLGFFFYQITQLYFKGFSGIPSSIYIENFDGKAPISVSTEPIYFLIIYALKSIGLSGSFALPIIIQSIYAAILYLFLKIAEPFQYKQKVAIIIMAAFSFMIISLSESILRQGIGFIFFTMFIFSNQKNKFIYILFAVLSHNIYGVFFVTYLFLEQFLKAKISTKLAFIITIILLIIFAKDFFNWLAHLTLRDSYKEYFALIDYKNFRYDFLIILSIYSLTLFTINLYIKEKNINLVIEKILILSLSAIIIQLAFFGMPFMDRIIYIPLMFVPIIIAIIFSKPKYLLCITSFCWVSVNLVYMTIQN